VSAPAQVRVTTTASTFRLRLRMNFRAMRRSFVVIAAVGLLLAVILCVPALALPWPGVGPSAWEIVLWSFGLFELLLSFPLALVCLFRSIDPSPLERLLPKAIVFRADGVRVEPKSEPPYETSWHWMAHAEEREGAIDLVLDERPRLVITLEKSKLPAAEYELVRAWLERNEKLPASRG
jgi:hypothetical protein